MCVCYDKFHVVEIVLQVYISSVYANIMGNLKIYGVLVCKRWHGWFSSPGYMVIGNVTPVDLSSFPHLYYSLVGMGLSQKYQQN